MRHSIIIILFSTFISSAEAQNVNITVTRPKLNEIQLIEAKNKGSKFRYNFPVSLSTGYFPGSDKHKLAQPIPYLRQTTPNKTTIDYYFSIPDSTIRLIEYSWNNRGENINDLPKLFDNNSRQLSKYFKNSGKLTNEDHSDWSQKTVIWENSLVHVKQYMVTAPGNNKVRVLVSWK